MNIISSRTPEGSRGHCPLCGNAECIEPSSSFGDAPCPHCGHLMCFLSISERQWLLAAENTDARDRVLRVLAEQLRVSVEAIRSNPKLINDLGADSVGMVELVMELEEELD